MTSLTVDSTTPLAASIQVPSPAPELSDEKVTDPSRKDMTNSGTADYRVQSPACYERTLGHSEVSYYLPGRANGVNDMFVTTVYRWLRLLTPPDDRYLHLGFTSPKHLVLRARVRTVWAILRMRHPLLASKVVMRDYDDVRFVYVFLLISRASRRSVHIPFFVWAASIRLHLQKTVLRTPTVSSIIDIKARTVCTETRTLACRY